MKPLAVVIGIVFAAAVAALAVALAFPDRFGDYLPEVLQPSVEGGTQLVLGVEPDGVDMGQAVAESIRVIERRLKDLNVRFKAQPDPIVILRLRFEAHVEVLEPALDDADRLRDRLADVDAVRLDPQQKLRAAFHRRLQHLRQIVREAIRKGERDRERSHRCCEDDAYDDRQSLHGGIAYA